MAKKVQKAKIAPKKAAKPAPKKVAIKASAKPVAKKAAKPVAKKAAKPVAKKVVAKPVAKKVAKPVAKKVVKPIAKKVTKPVAKKIVKPVAKKVAKPVAKKAVKPVAKKVVKPIAKKVTKPVAKKAAKPAAKKVVKPVAKKATKTAAEKFVAKAVKVVKEVAAKVVKAVSEATDAAPKKPSRRKKSKYVLPAKPQMTKPKTVAELIEANKIPVDKTFPSSKKDSKPARPSYDNTSLYGNDKPVKAPIIGKSKFTDAELKEFKDLINKKIAEAVKDYELLKDTLSHRDNNGTDDTSPTFKLLEDGSEVMSKEETTQLAIRQEKFIQNLKNALIRIENKTYGVCRATGKMISKERLRSVPHATLSIEAKRDQN